MSFRPTWTQLADFEGHEVNSRGEIRHMKSKNRLMTSTNQFGTIYVSIRNTREGKYQNKPVAVLVAETFVARTNAEHDTVIHLDGNQQNVHAENLRWGSRWHAIAYHREIVQEFWHAPRRVRMDDGPTFSCIADAAKYTTCLPSSIDYALRYNTTMALNEHTNFVQRTDPGGIIFRE